MNLPAAFNVVPRIADQRNLVENGLIHAEVGRDVARLVTTMEHLALRLHVGVEPGLGLGCAGERGDGNGVVHREAGVTGANQSVHLSSRQSRLKLNFKTSHKVAVFFTLHRAENFTFRRSHTNLPASLLLSQATAPMTRRRMKHFIFGREAWRGF